MSLNPFAEFQVGKAEKHSIRIDVVPWLDFVKTFVDGREIPRAKIRTSGLFNDVGVPPKKFTVGEKEQHKIEVRVDTGSQTRIELLADGQLVPARNLA